MNSNGWSKTLARWNERKVYLTARSQLAFPPGIKTANISPWGTEGILHRDHYCQNNPQTLRDDTDASRRVWETQKVSWGIYSSLKFPEKSPEQHSALNLSVRNPASWKCWSPCLLWVATENIIHSKTSTLCCSIFVADCFGSCLPQMTALGIVSRQSTAMADQQNEPIVVIGQSIPWRCCHCWRRLVEVLIQKFRHHDLMQMHGIIQILIEKELYVSL